MAWANHGGMGATTLAVPFIFSNKEPHRPPSMCSPNKEHRLRLKASHWERPYQRVKTEWDALKGNAVAQSASEPFIKTGTAVRIPENELREFRKFTHRYFGDITEKGLRRVFRAMNFTKDSKLQQVEFVEGCRHIGYPTRLTDPISDKRRKKLFYLLDPDRSGGLDFKEFKRGFKMGDAAAPELRPAFNPAEELAHMEAQEEAARNGPTVAQNGGLAGPRSSAPVLAGSYTQLVGNSSSDAEAAVAPARAAHVELASRGNSSASRVAYGTMLVTDPMRRCQLLPPPAAMATPTLPSTQRIAQSRPQGDRPLALPSSASAPHLPRIVGNGYSGPHAQVASMESSAVRESADRVMRQIMSRVRPLLREEVLQGSKVNWGGTVERHQQLR